MTGYTYTVYGIDPGLSGAIALIKDARWDGGSREVSVWDMPTRMVSEKKVKGKVQRRYGLDPHGVYSILMPYGDRSGVVYMEKVHAMPGRDAEGKASRSMGATSAFNFGAAFGGVQSLCEIVRLTYAVTPQAWKKHFGLIGADKDASRLLAKELVPDLKCLERKKDCGRAEAVLIALYGIHLEKEKRGHAVR